MLTVSAKSIGQWEDMRNYATHGIVDPKSPLWCCPRTLNMENVGSCVSLSKKLRHGSSKLLDRLAPLYDANVSISALPDNLQDIVLICKVMRRVAAERDDAHQSEWIWSGY